jgi:hypothetical protein
LPETGEPIPIETALFMTDGLSADRRTRASSQIVAEDQ